jgi:hypothetical protein
VKIAATGKNSASLSDTGNASTRLNLGFRGSCLCERKAPLVVNSRHLSEQQQLQGERTNSPFSPEISTH